MRTEARVQRVRDYVIPRQTRRKIMSAKFVLKKTSNGQYQFNLKAPNGEVILTSEMYAAKGSIQIGIDSVKLNSISDGRYERKTSKSGEPYFVLKAVNGEIIGRSELYSTARAMEAGIDSVKRNAPAASIEDLTEAARSQSS
jgi:uncharacterized protein YegP (UPF0339 family)